MTWIFPNENENLALSNWASMDDQIASDNPFSAPQASSSAKVVEKEAAQPTTLGQIGKRVFLEWEKLRLAYIGILVIFTVLIGLPQWGNPAFWVVAFFGAIVANVCYFLGPIVETYVTWLGLRSLAVRWSMFILGTLFTMAGAAAVILALPSGM